MDIIFLSFKKFNFLELSCVGSIFGHLGSFTHHFRCSGKKYLMVFPWHLPFFFYRFLTDILSCYCVLPYLVPPGAFWISHALLQSAPAEWMTYLGTQVFLDKQPIMNRGSLAFPFLIFNFSIFCISIFRYSF